MLAVVSTAHAAFPGANGKLVYQKGAEIHVIDADGTNDASLGPGSGPSWSPDGAKIAFVDSPGLWVMNADGTNRHQVVGGSADGHVEHPAWSPDGTKLVFARVKTGESGYSSSILATVNADGTGETTILRSQNPNPLDPVWSPDGTKIAFAGHIGAIELSPGDIYTINPDGTGLEQLTASNDFDDGNPDWAPDGLRLVAVDDLGIYTMNRDGTGVAPLRAGGWPAWSPDGRNIAFADYSFSSGSYDIHVMNADGTGVTRLTTDSALDTEPDWQPLRGPQRGDYKNAAQFCKAERDFLGEAAFREKYGGGANAHGKCVSQSH